MIEKTSYLVVGYDLSNVVDRKRYEEWTHSVEEPSMQMYLTENEMNIFDDPILNSLENIVGEVLRREISFSAGEVINEQTLIELYLNATDKQCENIGLCKICKIYNTCAVDSCPSTTLDIYNYFQIYFFPFHDCKNE